VSIGNAGLAAMTGNDEGQWETDDWIQETHRFDAASHSQETSAAPAASVTLYSQSPDVRGSVLNSESGAGGVAPISPPSVPQEEMKSTAEDKIFQPLHSREKDRMSPVQQFEYEKTF
jgi:hypothetical protein